MIIKSTETLREYISVNGSVDIDNLTPYLRKAERTFLKPIIGKAQMLLFEKETTDDILKQAIELAQEVIANYAYFLYLPIGAVQVTDSGIMVVANENTKQASDKQFKELQRSFLKSAHEALDELLAFMEESADTFLDWFNSPYYTNNNNLLIHKTSVFNEYYYIFNSRQTFIALKPNMVTVEDRFIKTPIGKELLASLKSPQTTVNRKEVKELLQKAIVAFTVMLTVDNGMFALDAKGMHMRFDVLPYEKVVTNVNIKVNDFLVRTKENKQISGEQYLKMALDIIKDAPTEFPEYIIKQVVATEKLTVTSSIVGM